MAPNNPMPRVSAVSAGSALTVSITWKAGARTGKTETLDLAPIINAGKFFRPLRTDRPLFESVHTIVGGNAIAWGDDEAIDLSATSLERLAEETMTGEDLRDFLAARDLTETALAATLDYSRRQIVNFVNNDRVIPRVVSLACRYIELQNPIIAPGELMTISGKLIQTNADNANILSTHSEQVTIGSANDPHLKSSYAVIRHAA